MRLLWHQIFEMKKKVLFVLTGSFILTVLHAQQTKLPSQVLKSFNARYPHAENVSLRDWQSCYRAEFVLNGTKMTANFTVSGELISTERTMQFQDMPHEIKGEFNKSKYAGWEKETIKESQIFGKPLQYTVMVKKGVNLNKTLIYDVNGRLMREETP